MLPALAIVDTAVSFSPIHPLFCYSGWQASSASLTSQ